MGFADTLESAREASQSTGNMIFLTGAPGSGKTTLIGTLEDIPELAGHVLYLSCSGGVKSIRDRPGIAVRYIDRWSVMEEARKHLTSKENDFKVVCVDLVSEVYQILLNEVRLEGMSTKAGRATLEARGVANDRFVDMCRNYRLLSEERGIHVVFTSHTSETKDDDSGMIMVRPNLTPGTLSTVLGIANVATLLDIKKGKRIAYLVGTDRIWAKVQKPVSEGEVPAILEEPTFAKIFDIVGL